MSDLSEWAAQSYRWRWGFNCIMWWNFLKVRGYLSPWSRVSPSSCSGSIQTNTSYNSGTNPHWSMSVDKVQEEGQDTVCTVLLIPPPPGPNLPIPASVATLPSHPPPNLLLLPDLPAPVGIGNSSASRAFLSLLIQGMLLQSALQHFYNSLCWQNVHSASTKRQ